MLADRGFDIGDSVVAMQATLNITCLYRGKKSAVCTKSWELHIANVHIHVERFIGTVRLVLFP